MIFLIILGVLALQLTHSCSGPFLTKENTQEPIVRHLEREKLPVDQRKELYDVNSKSEEVVSTPKPPTVKRTKKARRNLKRRTKKKQKRKKKVKAMRVMVESTKPENSTLATSDMDMKIRMEYGRKFGYEQRFQKDDNNRERAMEKFLFRHPQKDNNNPWEGFETRKPVPWYVQRSAGESGKKELDPTERTIDRSWRQNGYEGFRWNDRKNEEKQENQVDNWIPTFRQKDIRDNNDELGPKMERRNEHKQDEWDASLGGKMEHKNSDDLLETFHHRDLNGVFGLRSKVEDLGVKKVVPKISRDLFETFHHQDINGLLYGVRSKVEVQKVTSDSPEKIIQPKNMSSDTNLNDTHTLDNETTYDMDAREERNHSSIIHEPNVTENLMQDQMERVIDHKKISMDNWRQKFLDGEVKAKGILQNKIDKSPEKTKEKGKVSFNGSEVTSNDSVENEISNASDRESGNFTSTQGPLHKLLTKFKETLNGSTKESFNISNKLEVTTLTVGKSLTGRVENDFKQNSSTTNNKTTAMKNSTFAENQTITGLSPRVEVKASGSSAMVERNSTGSQSNSYPPSSTAPINVTTNDLGNFTSVNNHTVNNKQEIGNTSVKPQAAAKSKLELKRKLVKTLEKMKKSNQSTGPHDGRTKSDESLVRQDQAQKGMKSQNESLVETKNDTKLNSKVENDNGTDVPSQEIGQVVAERVQKASREDIDVPAQILVQQPIRWKATKKTKVKSSKQNSTLQMSSTESITKKNSNKTSLSPEKSRPEESTLKSNQKNSTKKSTLIKSPEKSTLEIEIVEETAKKSNQKNDSKDDTTMPGQYQDVKAMLMEEAKALNITYEEMLDKYFNQAQEEAKNKE